MSRERKAAYWVVAILVLGMAVGLFFLMNSEKEAPQSDPPAETWEAKTEGFLAVATPCCTRASLWEDLDATTPDGQKARPATAVEVIEWLNAWPYRTRQQLDESEETEVLTVAAQSTEVRCTGKPTGDKVPQRGNELETLDAIGKRRECTYAKWKVWSGETAARRPNERHTVWVDEAGFFRGRVDYWR